ncbi:hypothetical protein CfE428DRAFT_2464 [Chthoniobacter flavus Ellin428]|uniref:Uncharacterized protein n=1 Tax=Chthoniobacter flavus Ellin428 TaxID=497964 RepID=B4D0L3_9BACT|nr:hypothetical protein [Chthoniobacter flavus]EDY19875.1 hypothetical protein CfE428DRAFT_2464 [Chthoniobacter flavus Ellin428]TCO91854.1 hypothetical protein EV701_107135 [Chthoniobacter flavus]
MNTTRLFLISLWVAGVAVANASEPANFITRLGTYSLTPDTELRLFLNENGEVTYSLKTTTPQSDGSRSISETSSTHAERDKSFLFFWHGDTHHLWWATSDYLEFLDWRNPWATKSVIYDRASGLRLENIPPVFRETVEKTFAEAKER